MHCLWAESNNRVHGQFECDLIWFCFCFDFVRSHARLCCFSIVFLSFQVVQIKQVNCEMSTKNVINYKWKIFCDIFGQGHTQEYKATRKQIVRLQLNEKKSEGSQTRLMSWYWKRKPTWKKDLIYNSHPWIMLFFNWLVIIWKGREDSLETGRPRSRGWKNFGRRWKRGVGILKIGQFSWTPYVYHP